MIVERKFFGEKPQNHVIQYMQKTRNVSSLQKSLKYSYMITTVQLKLRFGNGKKEKTRILNIKCNLSE